MGNYKLLLSWWGMITDVSGTKAKIKYTCNFLQAIVGRGLFLSLFPAACFLPFLSVSAPTSVFSCSVSLLGSSQVSSFPVCAEISPRLYNQLLHCDSSALYLELRRPGKSWFISIFFLSFPSLFHIALHEY